MISRRRLLVIVALALLVTDALLLFTSYKRHLAFNAMVTYVGLDSIDMLVPVGMRPAKLRGGEWDVDPIPTLNAAMLETSNDAHARPISLVSLAPEATYGKAQIALRSLKARKVCNVLIRESGRVEPGTINFPDGPERAIRIPALVLCGSSIGDAGFSGVLPADGPIHVDHDD